jgi:hypothetical protein
MSPSPTTSIDPSSRIYQAKANVAVRIPTSDVDHHHARGVWDLEETKGEKNVIRAVAEEQMRMR